MAIVFELSTKRTLFESRLTSAISEGSSANSEKILNFVGVFDVYMGST